MRDKIIEAMKAEINPTTYSNMDGAFIHESDYKDAADAVMEVVRENAVGIYNTILPKSTDHMLSSTVKLREPDKNRDVNYSPLHDCIMSNICESLKAHTDKETFQKAWSSSLFPERATKAILRGVEEYIERATTLYLESLTARKGA